MIVSDGDKKTWILVLGKPNKIVSEHCTDLTWKVTSVFAICILHLECNQSGSRILGNRGLSVSLSPYRGSRNEKTILEIQITK